MSHPVEQAETEINDSFLPNCPSENILRNVASALTPTNIDN